MPDTASFSVDDFVFTAKETEQVIYEYNDANELTTSTQAGFDTDYSYDDWGRMVTKEQSANSYLATYKWRYGSKLKVAESNFPGEGDVGYMYDGLGKRRFRQTDVESANIDTWYRWDTKGHVLAEYENDTGAFWDIGDMSMYLVPGSVLAQSKGNSPGTDAMHYHHPGPLGGTALMTNDDKDVTYRGTAPDPDMGESTTDDSSDGSPSSGEEPARGYDDMIQGPRSCMPWDVHDWAYNEMNKHHWPERPLPDRWDPDRVDWAGENNALRHCIGQCIMKKVCGQVLAFLSGAAHEFWPQLRRRDLDDSWADTQNNKVGRELAGECGDPEDCVKKCRDAFDRGDLSDPRDYVPPRPPGYPLM